MTVSEYFNKYGMKRTLRKLNKKRLAIAYNTGDKYIKKVLRRQGIMLFDNRPLVTQKKLSFYGKQQSKCHDMVWDNRHNTI